MTSPVQGIVLGLVAGLLVLASFVAITARRRKLGLPTVRPRQTSEPDADDTCDSLPVIVPQRSTPRLP